MTIRFIVICLLIGASARAADSQTLSTAQAQAFFSNYLKGPAQPWPKHFPSRQDIPLGSEGNLIRNGIAILEQTSKLVGPNAPIAEHRMSQNNLNCVNCHPAGPSGLPGTRPGQLPYVNVIHEYPKLDVKSMKMMTLQDRIRTMFGGGNGRLTDDSAQMQALVAYMQWLGKLTQPGARLAGSFLADVDPPAAAASPTRGKLAYTQRCMACHGPEGRGIPKPDFATGGGYLVPPVAGDDTYTDAGHMYLVPLLARFIYGYMPPGSTDAQPGMTVNDAFDIAAYINTDLARKHDAKRVEHYPNKLFRPFFVATPEFFGRDLAAHKRAKYGPYKRSELNDFR